MVGCNFLFFFPLSVSEIKLIVFDAVPYRNYEGSQADMLSTAKKIRSEISPEILANEILFPVGRFSLRLFEQFAR